MYMTVQIMSLYQIVLGKCNHPLQEQSNTCVQAINYINPATVGTNVILRCSSRDGELDQTVVTCNNRKWSPDPREFIQSCKGMFFFFLFMDIYLIIRSIVNCSTSNIMIASDVSLIYNFTLEGSSLIVWCQNGLLSRMALTATCSCDGNWIPDPHGYDCSTLFPVTGVKFCFPTVNFL